VADERPNVFGRPHPIPAVLDNLPTFVTNIIDEHMQEHPRCDLLDVLTGQKSFQAALERSGNA